MAEEDFYDQDRGEIEVKDGDIGEGDEWKVIEAYFTSSSQVLVQQQLDSFDAFCISSINEIIRDAEVASVKVDPNNPADRVCQHKQCVISCVCVFTFCFFNSFSE